MSLVAEMREDFRHSRNLREDDLSESGRLRYSLYGLLCEVYRRTKNKGVWRRDMFGWHFVINGVIYRSSLPPEVSEWSQVWPFQTTQHYGQLRTLDEVQWELGSQGIRGLL